jgi:CheY-like chemotaxis protein
MDMMLPGETPTVRPRILLVEDDAAVRRSLQLLFRANGYDVRAYSSPRGLASDQEALRSDCLVADLMMPDQDAVGLLSELRAAGWQGPAVLISGFLTKEQEARARDAGFGAVLAKPIPELALSTAIAGLLGGAA